MEFSPSVIDKIDLLNTVLNELGVAGLFENADFSVDSESAGYYQVIVNSAPGNRKNLPFSLFLLGDEIRLDICGIAESFEWTNEDVAKSRNQIVSFFKKLFTGYILVESCGAANSKSRIYFFNKDGDFVEKYSLRGFIQKYAGWDCDKHLFFPLY